MGCKAKRSRRVSLLGPYLLGLAKTCSSQENPHRALEYASQAVEVFEKVQKRSNQQKNGLELVLSLQALADAQCKTGDYLEAVKALEKCLSQEIFCGRDHDQSKEEDEAMLLVQSSVYMQLGDSYALMGRQQSSLLAYHSALDAQKAALGEIDPCVAETCRILVEAHLQAMQIEQAEKLCKELIKMHELPSGSTTAAEESSDRRLMALIFSNRGDHKSALEQLLRASERIKSNEEEGLDSASIQACIGDTLSAMGRETEAETAYRSALSVFRKIKGENHAAVASVYLSLSDLQLKSGNVDMARFYCERASSIYERGPHSRDELVSGLVEIAELYESLGDTGRALELLHKALRIAKEVEVAAAARDELEKQEMDTTGRGTCPLAMAVLMQLGMLLCRVGRVDEGVLTLSKALHHPESD